MDRRTSVRDCRHRWEPPTIFALVALCFLLPFATVNLGGCDPDTGSTSFTGIQIVTRSVPPVTGAEYGLNAAFDRSNAARLASEVEKTGSGTAELAFGA